LLLSRVYSAVLLVGRKAIDFDIAGNVLNACLYGAWFGLTIDMVYPVDQEICVACRLLGGWARLLGFWYGVRLFTLVAAAYFL
jgi:hypothetical protein